jgi:drug/metabolite transporter (DMT)-like permease
MTGILLAIIGTGLFALKSIFIKLAYAEGLNSDSVLMLRMAISLPIYLLILVWLNKHKPIQKATLYPYLPLITLLGFIGYFLSSWLDLKGLEYISAQLERLTLFTYPIWVAILGALFFKTPLTLRMTLSIFIAYLGLWLVFNEELKYTGEQTLWGTIFVMLAAFSFSLYVLMSKKVIAKISSLWFTSLAMSISSIFVLLYYYVFFNISALVVTNFAWLWIFLLAIFSTVIPSFMIAEAIHRIGGAQTGVVGMLGPIITIFLAIWILNEPFEFMHLIGLILILAGIFILSVKKPKKHQGGVT